MKVPCFRVFFTIREHCSKAIPIHFHIIVRKVRDGDSISSVIIVRSFNVATSNILLLVLTKKKNFLSYGCQKFERVACGLYLLLHTKREYNTYIRCLTNVWEDFEKSIF